MARDDTARFEALQAEVARLRAENAALRAEQSATAEVLRVIASSPTDLEGVLQTIAEDAVPLCGAHRSAILVVEDDRVRTAAHAGEQDSYPRVFVPGTLRELSRGSVAGRAIVDSVTIHVPDFEAVQASEYPEV